MGNTQSTPASTNTDTDTFEGRKLSDFQCSFETDTAKLWIVFESRLSKSFKIQRDGVFVTVYADKALISGFIEENGVRSPIVGQVALCADEPKFHNGEVTISFDPQNSTSENYRDPDVLTGRLDSTVGAKGHYRLVGKGVDKEWKGTCTAKINFSELPVGTPLDQMPDLERLPLLERHRMLPSQMLFQLPPQMPPQTPFEVPFRLSHQMSRQNPHQMFSGMPFGMPDQVSNQLPPQMPHQTPHQTPAGMPFQIPHQIPFGMSYQIPYRHVPPDI